GGGTSWDNATPDEIIDDLNGIITKAVNDMKQAGGAMFAKFVILLPIDKYNKIATKRIGDGSDKTILRFVLENNPWIEGIEPWHRCSGAGANSSDRMVASPRNPLVIAGIVPMEFTTIPPQLRNFEYLINCMASCGGVVCRYPVAVVYCDGI